MKTDTTNYYIEVTLGSTTFHPVIHVADNGRWQCDDDGLEATIGHDKFTGWLCDFWASLRDKSDL